MRLKTFRLFQAAQKGHRNRAIRLTKSQNPNHDGILMLMKVLCPCRCASMFVYVHVPPPSSNQRLYQIGKNNTPFVLSLFFWTQSKNSIQLLARKSFFPVHFWGRVLWGIWASHLFFVGSYIPIIMGLIPLRKMQWVQGVQHFTGGLMHYPSIFQYISQQVCVYVCWQHLLSPLCVYFLLMG